MVRSTNQDAIYLNRELNLFVVADGMGCHNGCDIASSMAVKYIPEYFYKHIDENPINITQESIKSANKAIKQRGEKDSTLEGMGTTAVTLFFKEYTLYIGNVGDSRAYLVNNNKLFQLSQDHSLVQEKLNMAILEGVGKYDRNAAAKDPHKNVICRTVGFEENVQVDVFTYKVSKNDLFFMCSDGLHGKVSDSDILHIIKNEIPDSSAATKESVQLAVEKLVDQANANGGNDNISVVMVVAK